MPFLRIKSKEQGEFPFLKPRTNAGGHIMLGHFTDKRQDETGNSQGQRRAKGFAKDKEREMCDSSPDFAKHPSRKVVKNQTANAGASMKLGKRFEKIPAFPVDAVGEGGRSGYEVQAGDQ